VDIRENDRAKVTIDGYVVRGFIDDRTCPDCGGTQIYHEDFDAYFCAPCNQWKEARCGDGGCEFCSKRPETPLPKG
jgi:hypothetical protein